MIISNGRIKKQSKYKLVYSISQTIDIHFGWCPASLNIESTEYDRFWSNLWYKLKTVKLYNYF